MSGIKHTSVGQVMTEAEWEADDIHILESGTSFPGSPSEMDLFYRTDEHKWYVYNGTEWRELTAAGIDISDADAAVGDVKSPKTFYSVELPKKTGTMPTVAIAPGSSAYPAGYHAGDGGGLPAIDADLVTGSIKSGITIFNVLGHTDVRNVSDADALVTEVKSPKTFYAVGGAKKTGTMPTRAIVASNDLYQAGYHAGNAGGLDAIDVHLAPANIKSGVNIFGKVGTMQPLAYALGNYVMAGLDITTQNSWIGHLATSYTKVISIYSIGSIFNGKTLRIRCNLKETSSGWAYCRVYRNSSPVGTERSTQSQSFITYTQDISGWTTSSHVELWSKRASPGFVVTNLLEILGSFETGKTYVWIEIQET